MKAEIQSRRPQKKKALKRVFFAPVHHAARGRLLIANVQKLSDDRGLHSSAFTGVNMHVHNTISKV